MTEMLLLGAGASVDAGVPSSNDMTKVVFRLIGDDKFQRVISLVIGGLQFQKGATGKLPLDLGVDVESLFRAVQLLSERHESEAAPFISSWNYLIDDLDRPGLEIGEITEAFKAFSRLLVSAAQGGNFSSYLGRLELAKIIEQHIPRSGGGEIFKATNKEMVATLRDICWLEDSDRVLYLSPLLRLLRAQSRLVVATLNYDNSVELMAQSHGIECKTGIDGWSQTEHLDIGGDGLHVLKLHGSINWELIEAKCDPDRPMPHSVIHRRSPEQMAVRRKLFAEFGELTKAEEHDEAGVRKVMEELDADKYQPAVIFGHGNKLTADGPYLDLLRAFRDELAKSDLLTVIGYSFRDEHINEYITRWLNGDASRRLRIANGPNFADAPTGYAKLLRKHVPDRVDFVPFYAAAALLELWG